MESGTWFSLPWALYLWLVPGLSLSFKSPLRTMIKISPPPPDSLAELQSVIHQFNNRVNPPYAQHALDKNISGVFEKLLALNGIHDEVSNIRRSIRLTVPFIVL